MTAACRCAGRSGVAARRVFNGMERHPLRVRDRATCRAGRAEERFPVEAAPETRPDDGAEAGEVHLVAFDPTLGAEIRKTRPALVRFVRD